MTQIAWLLAVLFILSLPFQSFGEEKNWASWGNYDLCFTWPAGNGCEDMIASRIDKSTKRIDVQAYYFTNKKIADALCRAKKRGVDIAVLLDRSQKEIRFDAEKEMAAAGIPLFIDSKHAIAHNKVMVFDEEYLLTGSYNFTEAAEKRNAENSIIIHDKDLAYSYTREWLLHWTHSAGVK